MDTKSELKAVTRDGFHDRQKTPAPDAVAELLKIIRRGLQDKGLLNVAAFSKIGVPVIAFRISSLRRIFNAFKDCLEDGSYFNSLDKAGKSIGIDVGTDLMKMQHTVGVVIEYREELLREWLDRDADAAWWEGYKLNYSEDTLKAEIILENNFLQKYFNGSDKGMNKGDKVLLESYLKMCADELLLQWSEFVKKTSIKRLTLLHPRIGVRSVEISQSNKSDRFIIHLEDTTSYKYLDNLADAAIGLHTLNLRSAVSAIREALENCLKVPLKNQIPPSPGPENQWYPLYSEAARIYAKNAVDFPHSRWTNLFQHLSGMIHASASSKGTRQNSFSLMEVREYYIEARIVTAYVARMELSEEQKRLIISEWCNEAWGKKSEQEMQDKKV